MDFLELTSLIGEPEEYADFPDYQSDVWPFMRRKAEEIRSVFLFRTASRGFNWPGQYQVITQNIIRIGTMGELSDPELRKIHYWSFYEGHLNVLYQVSTEGSLLRELCEMYPVVELSNDEIDQLALDPKPLTELRAFIAAAPQGLLHFAFSHDADPLFIFGDLDQLTALMPQKVS